MILYSCLKTSLPSDFDLSPVENSVTWQAMERAIYSEVGVLRQTRATVTNSSISRKAKLHWAGHINRHLNFFKPTR